MEVTATINDKISLLESTIVEHFKIMDPNDRAAISELIEKEFMQYSFQTLVLTHGIDELKAKLGQPEHDPLLELTRDVLFKYALNYNRFFNEPYEITALLSPILQARKALLSIALAEDIEAGRYTEADKVSYVALIFVYIIETLSADYDEGYVDGKPTTSDGDA